MSNVICIDNRNCYVGIISDTCSRCARALLGQLDDAAYASVSSTVEQAIAAAADAATLQSIIDQYAIFIHYIQSNSSLSE